MLKIKLGRLKHDTGFSMLLDIQATCDAAAYGYSDIAFGAPLSFSGKAENVDGEIHINGQITAHLMLCCARCGVSFPLDISLPFSEIYSSSEVNPDTEGLQDKRHFSGDTIDIMPEILRLLYEELPMQPLCREDCRGLCPLCGTDLNHGECSCSRDNIDPRWQKLRGLLEK